MNTEVRLAAELVYQNELRYTNDYHIMNTLAAGMTQENVLIPLETMVNVLLPNGFCAMLCLLSKAGMSFIDIQWSIDSAIRRKYWELVNSGKEDEA